MLQIRSSQLKLNILQLLTSAKILRPTQSARWPSTSKLPFSETEIQWSSCKRLLSTQKSKIFCSCETSFKFDTVKVISGSRKRRGARQQQKEVSPSDIFTTNAEFAVYKNSTLPLKEGLFGVENSDVSELEALRELARISNRAEVRAVVQPGAYLS